MIEQEQYILTNNQIRIVMYHYTRDLAKSRYPQIKGLDYKLFKQQIEFLTKNFNIVTMEQVIQSTNIFGGGMTVPCLKMLCC